MESREKWQTLFFYIESRKTNEWDTIFCSPMLNFWRGGKRISIISCQPIRYGKKNVRCVNRYGKNKKEINVKKGPYFLIIGEWRSRSTCLHLKRTRVNKMVELFIVASMNSQTFFRQWYQKVSSHSYNLEWYIQSDVSLPLPG